MGFRFRKSIKAGPVRFNLSKSGVSTSVGVKGARITKRADGKTQATVSAPGTGVSYTTTTGTGNKKTTKKKKNTTIAGVLACLLLFVGCVGMMGDSDTGNDAGNNAAVSDSAAVDSAQNDVQQDDAQMEDSAKDTGSNAAAEDLAGSDAGKDVDNSTSLPPDDTQTGAAAETNGEDDTSAGEELPPDDQGQSDDTQQGADDSAGEQGGKEGTVDPPKQEEPAKPKQPVQQEPTGPGVIGNANSHVYHELGCGSVKKMSEKNKRPFANAAAAQAAGYDPCQNCH